MYTTVEDVFENIPQLPASTGEPGRHRRNDRRRRHPARDGERLDEVRVAPVRSCPVHLSPTAPSTPRLPCFARCQPRSHWPCFDSRARRTSDAQHHRNQRTAELEADELERRATRTLVLEEIEDFEHKLGWKMRKNLGASLRSSPCILFSGSTQPGY